MIDAFGEGWTNRASSKSWCTDHAALIASAYGKLQVKPLEERYGKTKPKVKAESGRKRRRVVFRDCYRWTACEAGQMALDIVGDSLWVVN